MFDVSVDMNVGHVDISTTHYRGHSVDDLTDMCLDHIMTVSKNAPPAIRDQAFVYKERIRSVIKHYMTQAVKSDRTTLYNKMTQEGHEDIAKAILKF
ncbi:MAG: hypothetical protein CML19_10605 [Pusillimonas sp.]|jgi:hypothetical protein|nr:hypothetical protein [Pusillimonas sp.]